MSDLSELRARLPLLLAPVYPEATRIEVTQIAPILGGWSKRMYSFDVAVHGADEAHPATAALVLRINAPDNVAILRNDRGVEHTVLTRLRRHTSLPVPRSYVVDARGEHFGAQAMVLERLPGNPRITTVADDELESIAEHLVELLAELHRTPVALLSPDGLLDDPNGWGVQVDSWDSYMESSSRAWIERYRDVAFDTLPVIYDGFLTVRRRRPRPLPLVVLHGELNPNNLITERGKIVGLIDWERPHIGDPREDLAYFRLFERTMAGTNLFGRVSRAGGFLGYYNELTGFDVTEEELDYFTVFSHSDVSYGPYSSIRRGLRGEHDHISATYFLAEVILAQCAIGALVAASDSSRR